MKHKLGNYFESKFDLKLKHWIKAAKIWTNAEKANIPKHGHLAVPKREQWNDNSADGKKLKIHKFANSYFEFDKEICQESGVKPLITRGTYKDGTNNEFLHGILQRARAFEKEEVDV